MADAIQRGLWIESPGGQRQRLVAARAQLPARARAVFATQRAGERSLQLRLSDGEQAIGDATCELPAGLPPNTWMQVYVTVSADHEIAIEVTENLRRLRLDAELEMADGVDTPFQAG